MIKTLIIFGLLSSSALAQCGNSYCAMCARNYGTQPGFTLVNGPGYGRIVRAPVIDATPHRVVQAMLSAVNVGIEDLVYDPGCGDGRIVIAAAKLGARAVGIEIDPSVSSIAENKVREARVKSVRIVTGDSTKLVLSKATVIAMYLSKETIAKLAPRIPLTTRIVSYNHPIPGRENEKFLVDDKHVIYVSRGVCNFPF